MRGADDPGVRKQAIDRLTEQLIQAVKDLQRAGVPPDEIEARIRELLGPAADNKET